MSELVRIGAITRWYKKIPGLRGRGMVRYAMNPHVATKLPGAARAAPQRCIRRRSLTPNRAAVPYGINGGLRRMSELETPEADMMRDHSSLDTAPATLRPEESRPGLDPDNPGAAPDTTLNHTATPCRLPAVPCPSQPLNRMPQKCSTGKLARSCFSGQGDIPLAQLDTRAIHE
jgi:hypothetical protein